MNYSFDKNTNRPPLHRSEILARVREIIPQTGELFLVGGAVRDLYLGRDSQDFDFAVQGLGPEDLLRLDYPDLDIRPLEIAGQAVGARLRHPDLPKSGVEIALTRQESSTGPGHLDWQIDLGASIEDDLRRRDFTCNALGQRIDASGEVGETIDPLGGIADTENRLLRQTHSAAISEDPLRILRAFVRVASDQFRLQGKTRKAIRQQAGQLSPWGPLPGERIWTELDKIIRSPDPYRALALMRDQGCYRVLFPELAHTVGFQQKSRYHRETVDQHCLLALRYAAENDFSIAVRWAALFHDGGKPASAWLGDDNRLHYYANSELGKRDHAEIGQELAGQILDRLRAPRDLRDEVVFLVGNHMWFDDRYFSRKPIEQQRLIARRFLRRFGREQAWELIDLRRADNAGKGIGPLPSFQEDLFRTIISEEFYAPVSRDDLLVDGRDLERIGFQGQEIAETLDQLLDRVLVEPEKNTRQQLIDWARELKTSG